MLLLLLLVIVVIVVTIMFSILCVNQLNFLEQQLASRLIDNTQLRAQVDILILLDLSDQLPKTQRHSIYNDINQSKVTNLHIGEAGTSRFLVFFPLESD